MFWQISRIIVIFYEPDIYSLTLKKRLDRDAYLKYPSSNRMGVDLYLLPSERNRKYNILLTASILVSVLIIQILVHFYIDWMAKMHIDLNKMKRDYMYFWSKRHMMKKKMEHETLLFS